MVLILKVYSNLIYRQIEGYIRIRIWKSADTCYSGEVYLVVIALRISRFGPKITKDNSLMVISKTRFKNH